MFFKTIIISLFPWAYCFVLFFRPLPVSSLILFCYFNFLHPLTLPPISATSFVSYLCFLSIHLQFSKFLDLICGPHLLSILPHKALPLNICLQINAISAEASKLKDEQKLWKNPKVWMSNIMQPFCLSSILPDPKIALFTVPEHSLSGKKKIKSEFQVLQIHFSWFAFQCSILTSVNIS